MNICIVMLSAIGDTVHVLPIINALKRHDDANIITWMLEPGPATLVRGHPSIDRIIDVDPHRGLSAFRSLRGAVRDHKFDLLLDLQVAFKAGLVTAATPARTKLGFDRARARDLNWLFTTRRIPAHPGRQHVQDQYFEFLAALGVPRDPIVWNLGPWPTERPWQTQFFSQFDRPVAALSIGASDPDREWLPDRWAAVSDALYADFGLQPVLVGAGTPRDRLAESAIRAAARHPILSALSSGLRPLVSILDGSALTISVDTGAVHIAVALDRPVIALMSNADPRRTGPYGKFQDLVVDAYHDPGDLSPINWTRRPGRMPLITVDTVLSRVAHWHRTYRQR